MVLPALLKVASSRDNAPCTGFGEQQLLVLRVLKYSSQLVGTG